MITHLSYCEFHLGDNLMHLHFLRALAKRHIDRCFVHAVHPCHQAQLQEVVADLRNIVLVSLEGDVRFREGHPHATHQRRNVWKNAFGYWESHRLRNDFSAFYLAWFDHLAGELGLANPLKTPEDLLFDYPALSCAPAIAGNFPPDGDGAHEYLDQKHLYDFLVVNSRPCSGQLLCYDSVDYMDPLIQALVERGHRVVVTQPTKVPTRADWEIGNGIICTHDHGLSISQIGALSRRCRHHIMVSTGPSWPTFNIWNNRSREGETRHRIVLLYANEQLNLPGIRQMSNLSEVMNHARLEGWV